MFYNIVLSSDPKELEKQFYVSRRETRSKMLYQKKIAIPTKNNAEHAKQFGNQKAR